MDMSAIKGTTKEVKGSVKDPEMKAAGCCGEKHAGEAEHKGGSTCGKADVKAVEPSKNPKK